MRIAQEIYLLVRLDKEPNPLPHKIIWNFVLLFKKFLNLVQVSYVLVYNGTE